MSTFHAISIVWALISFSLLILAWRFAAVGRISLHRNLMLFLSAGAWVFIASYLFQRPHAAQATAFPREYIPWIAFHGTMGLLVLLGATCIVVSRLRRRDGGQQSHLNQYHLPAISRLHHSHDNTCIGFICI